MNPSITVDVQRDEATPAVNRLAKALNQLQREVGGEVVRTVQAHLNKLGPNKQGWPSSGFYAGAARGTTWDRTDKGVLIEVDNEDRPGAMRQRYHGGTISMKDKLLSIPARQEFAGRSPTEFTNLRFVMFKSGAMAFVIGGAVKGMKGSGGVGLVDFATGRERNVKGAGVRSAGMVAFWLVDHVDQDPDPGVLPSPEEIRAAAIRGAAKVVAAATQRRAA